MIEYVKGQYVILNAPCRPYGQNQDGYGAKIATPYKLGFMFDDNREYRVYATCYGNSASHWIIKDRRKQHITL